MTQGINAKIDREKFLGSIPVRNVNGELLRYEKVFTKKKFSKLTIGSTRNTDVYCRICLGTGQIINSNGISHIETLCPECAGTRRTISL